MQTVAGYEQSRTGPRRRRHDRIAQDEYGGYLGVLGDLLRKGAGVRAVAEYLASCEHQMGFDTEPEQLTGVGNRITDWYSGGMAE